MKIILLCIAFAICCLSSCKKADYLTDDGLHVAEVNLSTYDYLAAHPHHIFDTLLMVVDHFGLKEEINNAKTFFVPTDYSINKYYNLRELIVQESDENAVYEFSQFLDELNVDSVRAYFYDGEQYSLDNANTSYTAIANRSGIDGFAFHKQKQPMAQWSYQDIFYLYYVKIQGEPDQTSPEGTPRVDRNDRADTRVLCQTTGIKTSSGTLINVLDNRHVFIEDFKEGESGPMIEDLENGGLRFTYAVSFKPSSAYLGADVVVSGEWIAEAFGVEAADIPGMIGSEITFGAIEPNGTFNTNSTANAPGHWFAADGAVVTWGETARLFSEYNASAFTFAIGQYPDRSAIGDSYTIKQAMRYTNRMNETIWVEFVFNISIR